MGSKDVVRVEVLRKPHGGVVAVDDVSFEVLEGEIIGLIGLNGAGKTTTMECASGLALSAPQLISEISSIDTRNTSDFGYLSFVDVPNRRDFGSLRRRTNVRDPA